MNFGTDNICPICYEELINICIFDCYHIICENCKIDKCPLCRNKSEPKILIKHNINDTIIENKKYVMLLPDSNTKLFLTCWNKAIFAADMLVTNALKDNVILNKNIGCGISYNYNNYDKIYFDTFNKMEKCILYKLI